MQSNQITLLINAKDQTPPDDVGANLLSEGSFINILIKADNIPAFSQLPCRTITSSMAAGSFVLSAGWR